MKIITEPSVHVLAIPYFFAHPEYELPEEGVDSTFNQSYHIHRLITHAGKGCYDSYGKDGRSIRAHISSLISSKHGSVLEHAHISLFLTGISRGLSHELVRHRHFNYSQRSTRYTAEEGAAIVLDPFYANLYLNPKGPEDREVINHFIISCESGLNNYRLQVEMLNLWPFPGTTTEKRKFIRGKARQLLPHALETRMTMTGNLRAWRHFIEERSSRHAEPEIRRLADLIFKTISPLAPYVFEDYKAEEINGFNEYTTEMRKV